MRVFWIIGEEVLVLWLALWVGLFVFAVMCGSVFVLAFWTSLLPGIPGVFAVRYGYTKLMSAENDGVENIRSLWDKQRPAIVLLASGIVLLVVAAVFVPSGATKLLDAFDNKGNFTGQSFGLDAQPQRPQSPIVTQEMKTVHGYYDSQGVLRHGYYDDQRVFHQVELDSSSK